MSNLPRKRIDARGQVLVLLAEKGPLNMWSIKKEGKMVYSTVHKAVDSLEQDRLIVSVGTVNSEKGGKTKLFKPSFRGFLRYLASYPDVFTPVRSVTPAETSFFTNYAAFRDYGAAAGRYRKSEPDFREELKKVHGKQRKRFLDDVKKLAGILERNGKPFAYPLFAECRALEKHFSSSIYGDFLDVARTTHAYSPFRVPAKKGQLPDLRRAEEDVLKRVFGERFLQRIVMGPWKRMTSDNLKAFAEDLRKRREGELKYLAAAVDLFS
jgi:hypothetical protein